MTVRATFVALVIGLCCLATATSVAQSTGMLAGQVTDPAGAVVPGAIVSVIAPSGQAAKALTNSRGAYLLKGLAPGQYATSVTAPGFAPSEGQVTISAGQTRHLDVALTIKRQEQIEVQGEPGRVDVNPGSNASSVVIAGRDLQALSDVRGELKSQLQWLSGAAAGPNHGRIFIDGFAGGELPPKSAISEIRVNENPFSAEYDQPGYQAIQIFTRSGTEQFHGEMSLSLNNSAFNSHSPFASQQPDYHSETFTASVGGPIRKRATFFLNAARLNNNDTSLVNAIVLDSNYNAVPFSQTIRTPRTETSISPRVDFQLTPRDMLSVRYEMLKTGDLSGGIRELALASQAYDLRSTEHTLQISNTHSLSPNTVNETRFQYVHHRKAQSPQDFAPTLSVLGAFVGGGNALGFIAAQSDRYEFQNNISTTRGKHLVKLGGRLRATQVTNSSSENFNGTFTFPSLNAYRITQLGLKQGWTAAQVRQAGGGASQFSIVTGQPQSAVSLLDAGLYAQDDWRLLPNFTLSYGLRFETQSGIRDHADLAPRVAIAWGVGRDKDGSPTTVLRAGFGIFYDRIGEDLLLQAERLNGSRQREIVVTSPDFFPGIPPESALARAQVLPTIYQLAPNLRAPYTAQFTFSVERQLSKAAIVSATYSHSRGLHQLLSRNINAPLPGTFDPMDPASGVRPLGDSGNIYQYESRGSFRQNQLITDVKLRAGSKLSLFGYYTLNYANSNTAGAYGFPANQYDLQSEYGRAAFDVRHQFFLGGTLELPYALHIAPFVTASSGQPFNITVGQDLNGDSLFNDRPAFANDLSRPTGVRTRWGAFDTAPVAGQAIIPPNSGTGPGQFTVNLKVSKTFRLGEKLEAGPDSLATSDRPEKTADHASGAAAPSRRYSLTVSASASNLLNRVNLAPPVGNLNSPLFGVSTASESPFGSAAANRRIDLQITFAF